MIRLEEFQVKCYERKCPGRSVTEVAQELEDKVNGIVVFTDEDREEVADSLRDMLVYVAKFADKIGYTLGEVAER